MSCVIAFDRTLGGSPSTAIPRGLGGLEEITTDLGGKFVDVSGAFEIGAMLSRSGNGARGIVAVHPRGNGVSGHVFNVVNDNGVIKFLDGQTGGNANDVLKNFDQTDFVEFLLTSPGK